MTIMQDFFFELLCEEIPASSQKFAEGKLKELFEKEANGVIKYSGLRTYVTPRRLVLFACVGSSEVTQSFEEIRGPRSNVDQEIIQKFLDFRSIKFSDCYTKKVGDKEYLFYKKNSTNLDIKSILQNIVVNIINNFKWPKSMRWNDSNMKWIRPLRNICCCLGNTPLKINIQGVGNSNKILTHMVLGKEVEVNSWTDYYSALKSNHVMLDRDSREIRITGQISDAEKKEGINKTVIREIPLVAELAYLVEWPVVVVGEIDPKFMALPSFIISNCMIHHQKFYPLYFDFEKLTPKFYPLYSDFGKLMPKFYPLYSDFGKLIPKFLSVCNNAENEFSECAKNFIKGNQKVLSARLSDAFFFYNNDLSKSIDYFVEKLKMSLFYEGLGSNYERMLRLEKTAVIIAKYLFIKEQDAKKIARLMKFDLATEIVCEFPELQGRVGQHYAEKYGEPLYIADTITQQYSGLIIKCSSIYGVLAALTDKIEMLLSFFKIGKFPTGSKDPLGMRSAGIGILQIIIGNELDFDLESVVKEVSIALGASKQADYFMQFIQDKLTSMLKVRPNLIKAMLVDVEGFCVNRIVACAESLKEFVEDANILAAYKRLANILPEEMMSLRYVDKTLLQEKAEKDLDDVLELFKQPDGKQFYQLMRDQMCPKLNDFLDNVMCNVDDDIIRNNRIALLSNVYHEFNRYIKFSLLF